MSINNTPSDWLKGFAQNWRSDLVAALSVALVALPLGLGIAIASGAPPMSGIISIIIGGVVTTFLRGSHVAINGPANSLIAIVLVAMASLDDGTGNAFSYVLAAFVVSGAIQVLLGLFRLGRLAEAIPSSVIQGILAAIGIIIVAKQLHVALGTSSDADNMIGVLIDAFKHIDQINPFVAIISVLGMLLLIFHARISYKLFHFLPAPMWVLILAIPFVYAFNFFDAHDISVMGKSYSVGPDLLVQIPNSLLNSLRQPDFSMLGKGSFWLVVFSLTLITTVESLASTKAVDKLDPYKRKTNLNRDLMAVGASSIASAFLGGLPIVTVIVRSTVNIHNNAKTRWSNFFHGIIVLLFILLLSPVMQMVPLAALAVILVFSGFKLTAPRVYVNTYSQGLEQLLFLMGTLIITLYTSLLWGVLGGIVLTLGVHILLARVPLSVFFGMIFRPGNKLMEKDDGSYELKVKGVANFLTMLPLNKLLEKVPEGANLKINVSTARLVDLTVLESLDDFKRIHQLSGAKVNMIGFEHHVASTNHRFALKSQTAPIPHRLSSREQNMKQIAFENNWAYRHEIEWDTYVLSSFKFFESRPIEYKTNIISGEYEAENIKWEICDITFDEGALMATEVYHTTVKVMRLPFEIPEFTLEAEGLFDKIFDRVVSISGHRDIDIEGSSVFSSKLLLKGEDEKAIKEFFSPELIKLFETEQAYHVESNGRDILIFRALRLARINEINKMLQFSDEFIGKIKKPIIVEETEQQQQ